MEELAEYALKISRARYVEVRIEKERKQDILFVNGMLREAGMEENYGFSVRVIDGGIGFYFSNIVNKEEIRKGVERAERMASSQRGKVGLSDEKMYQDKYEVKGEFPPIDEKIEYLKEIDGIAKKHERTISYEEKMQQKIYMNSEGAKIYSKIPRIYMQYLITVSDGKVEQMNREFGNAAGWKKMAEWRVEEHLQHDINFLKDLIEKGKKAPKQGDVILAPYITGLIAHESCGHPFEADRILGREAAQAGKSYASPDLIGKKIGNDCISIADDATLPGSYGFYRYDDEGVKARRRILIREGVVNEFLHNRETAYEMGTESNASARATYGKEPIVRMANTYFMPGDYTLEEMIEEIKQGVYMKTFMEWNIDDTRTNQKYVGQEAYVIRNGEIDGIAYHPAIEISTFDFYRKVDAAGRELKFYPATCGKGEPMQGIEVSTGGVDLRLRNVEIK